MANSIDHPRYAPPAPIWHDGFYAMLADDVALATAPHTSIGTVTAIYRESVELSTGDELPVRDLVLLHRTGLL